MTKEKHKGSDMRQIPITGKIAEMTAIDKYARCHILGFKTNKIRTTKYNIFSFLPKALLFQFSRFANVYFLITAVIQSIPYVSPLNPFSAILPLIFVLGVSMVREAVEDYSRYRTDCQINESKATILQRGSWVEVQWKEVFVGDFIRIKNEERFPADILVLNTSHKKENRGACYIETASLDGEKNLKLRSAIPEVMQQAESKGLESFEGQLTCSLPNANLHSYDGVIEVQGKQYAVSSKQLLLRGASLRNTEFIEGLVVYTGHDSKVMKNSENSRFKSSKLEGLMNSLILRLLILQALLYLAAMVGFLSWNIAVHKNYSRFWTYNYNYYAEAILMIFTYFILFNTMLPISLIVTLEMVKVCQSYFISSDGDFYNKKKDKGCKVMTRSINEEVGQVEYVFSDKTGTLTCNEMELKYLMIGGTIYSGIIEQKDSTHNVYSNVGEFYDKKIKTNLTEDSSEKLNIVLPSEGTDSYVIENRKQITEDFLTLLATCHDCMVDIDKNDKNVMK
jgi:phospholipid-transporting ATPase